MRTEELRKSETSRHEQVVVITGASAGVGRATARAFGRDGARVGLIARDEERLNATKAEIEQLGGRALVLPADVSDSSLIEKAAERMENEFGPIDIWVNNAMATVFAPFDALTSEEFKRATEVTYLGCVYGTMAALKRMKPRAFRSVRLSHIVRFHCSRHIAAPSTRYWVLPIHSALN